MMCTVYVEMPINKFGVSLEKNGAVRMDYYKWNGVLRNYMRDNALCVVGADFDAKSRKIRRVAQPLADTDAVNKLYVEKSIKFLRQQQEELERKLAVFQKDKLVVFQNSVQKISQALNSIPQPHNEIRKIKEAITAFATEQQLVQNFLGPSGST